MTLKSFKEGLPILSPWQFRKYRGPVGLRVLWTPKIHSLYCCRSGEGKLAFHPVNFLPARHSCILERYAFLLDGFKLLIYVAYSLQYNIYVAFLGGFPVIQDGSLNDGCGSIFFFFFKKALFVPWDFRTFHLMALYFTHTVRSCQCVRAVCFPQTLSRWREQLLEGENTFESTSSEENFSSVFFFLLVHGPSLALFPFACSLTLLGRWDWMFHLYIKIKNSNKNLAHMKNRPFGHMVHYAYSFNY